jgi:hypothetical protein
MLLTSDVEVERKREENGVVATEMVNMTEAETDIECNH